MAIGWSPEGTATHAAGAESLRRFALVQAVKQQCRWCWGQGYLMQASPFGYMPVTCPVCRP